MACKVGVRHRQNLRKGTGKLPNNLKGIGRTLFADEITTNFSRLLWSRGLDIDRNLARLIMFRMAEEVIPNARGKYNSIWDGIIREAQGVRELLEPQFIDDPKYGKLKQYLESSQWQELREFLREIKSTKARLRIATNIALSFMENEFHTTQFKRLVDLETKNLSFIQKAWSSKANWSLFYIGAYAINRLDTLNSYWNAIDRMRYEPDTDRLIIEEIRGWLQNRSLSDEWTHFKRELIGFMNHEITQTLAGEFGSVAITDILRSGTVRSLQFLAEAGFLVAQHHPSLKAVKVASRVANTVAHFLNKSVLAWLGWQIGVEWTLDGWIQSLFTDFFTKAGALEERIGNLTREEFNELYKLMQAQFTGDYYLLPAGRQRFQYLLDKASPNLVERIYYELAKWDNTYKILNAKNMYDPKVFKNNLKEGWTKTGEEINEFIYKAKDRLESCQALTEIQEKIKERLLKENMPITQPLLSVINSTPIIEFIQIPPRTAEAIAYGQVLTNNQGKAYAIFYDTGNPPAYDWTYQPDNMKPVMTHLFPITTSEDINYTDITNDELCAWYDGLEIAHDTGYFKTCAKITGNILLRILKTQGAATSFFLASRENRTEEGEITQISFENLMKLLEEGWEVEEKRVFRTTDSYVVKLTLRKDTGLIRLQERNNCSSVVRIYDKRYFVLIIPQEPYSLRVSINAKRIAGAHQENWFRSLTPLQPCGKWLNIIARNRKTNEIGLSEIMTLELSTQQEVLENGEIKLTIRIDRTGERKIAKKKVYGFSHLKQIYFGTDDSIDGLVEEEGEGYFISPPKEITTIDLAKTWEQVIYLKTPFTYVKKLPTSKRSKVVCS